MCYAVWKILKYSRALPPVADEHRIKLSLGLNWQYETKKIDLGTAVHMIILTGLNVKLSTLT